MNRPRPSVLAQFDPLLSDPEDSEQEYDSEKENNVPQRDELTMSSFFNRTYKRDHAMPAPLTRRLVDVGDVTIHDASLDDEYPESDMDMQTPKRRPEFKPHSRTPRTPLAEIALEREPSPLTHKKLINKRELALKPSNSPADKLSSSSLSSLIDAVNLAGTSFARSHTASSVNAGSAYPPPEIKIQSSSFGSSLIQETAPPFDLAASTITQPRVSNSSFLAPPLSRKTAHPVVDSRVRQSLDLDASFNLQASETSFDLLNDKMSFLDEKSFNMSFGNVHDDVSEEFNSPITSGPTTPVDFDKGDVDKNVTPTQEYKSAYVFKSKGSPVSPVVEIKDTVATPAPAVSDGQSNANFANTPAQSLTTPAIHRAATTTVPALRIIKRMKRYERPTTGPSAKSGPQSASAAVSGSTSLEKSPTSSDSESGVKPAHVTSAKQSLSPPVSKPIRCPGGPMRIPVSESSAAIVKSAAPRATSGTGPRRVPIEVPRQEPVPATKSARSLPAGRTNPSVVPRPVSSMSSGPAVSRLPAPSGIARRKPANSSTATVGLGAGGASARSVPRRYGYGQQA